MRRRVAPQLAAVAARVEFTQVEDHKAVLTDVEDLLSGPAEDFQAPLVFRSSALSDRILAEGHIHRSLGQPQEQVGTSVVWPKAIFSVLRRPR